MVRNNYQRSNFNPRPDRPGPVQRYSISHVSMLSVFAQSEGCGNAEQFPIRFIVIFPISLGSCYVGSLQGYRPSVAEFDPMPRPGVLLVSGAESSTQIESEHSNSVIYKTLCSHATSPMYKICFESAATAKSSRLDKVCIRSKSHPLESISQPSRLQFCTAYWIFHERYIYYDNIVSRPQNRNSRRRAWGVSGGHRHSPGQSRCHNSRTSQVSGRG